MENKVEWNRIYKIYFLQIYRKQSRIEKFEPTTMDQVRSKYTIIVSVVHSCDINFNLNRVR